MKFNKNKNKSKNKNILFFILGIFFVIIIENIFNFYEKNNDIKFNENNKIIKNKNFSENNENKKLYKISKVIDGDTVRIFMNGRSEKIRIIGINTPEIGERLQCFGQEAKKEAERVLRGKKVKVELDNSQGERDKYGRLLAYLVIEGKDDFGEIMIKNGFAYEFTYNRFYKKRNNYKKALRYAKKNKKGLWADGACDNFRK